MGAHTHDLDLAGLRLHPGEGHRLALEVPIEPFVLGGERYISEPACAPIVLEVSRMTGGGYALRLSFSTRLAGPCMRCLKDAAPQVRVDAREVSQPGGGEELSSPYVSGETLDLAAWAHDSLALSAPAQVLCDEQCPGLCPVCAVDLSEAGPNHSHERAPDPRWAKLGELRLED
jgi:uncharacterized protein